MAQSRRKKSNTSDTPDVQNMIQLNQLWQPAFNNVYNEIVSYIIGPTLRPSEMTRSKYDEIFLQGGRACVDGDTLISTPRGEVKIKDFNGGQIYAIGKDGKIEVAEACAATKYEPEKMYCVKTKSGRSITCTAEHRFLTSRGWTPLNELKINDKLIDVNCSHGTSPSVALRIAKGERDLQRSYYDEHLSVLHEDVHRSIRRLLGLIYRCSRDFHLCDEQLLTEAETYQDVLQLLVDAQKHSQRDSLADGQLPYDKYIRSCRYELLPSIEDCLDQYEDEYSTTLENQIFETLSVLPSEIYSSIRKSQTNDNLVGTIQQVASLVLVTKHWLSCQSGILAECYTRQVLCDTLSRRIDDQTFSDSLLKLDDVIHNLPNHIILDDVVSIDFVKEDCFYDIFVPFYNNYIGNGIVNHNSGKSYFASVIVWLTLENDPKKNAVVIRKVGSSIRKSCWKQMMKVRNRLGLMHWEPNKTELTFTNKLTGQQIFFVGLDDEEKVRSITVETGYIAIAWFEEAKQFSSMEEIDQAVASILRGGADDDERDYDEEDEGEQEYLTILTYNPPKSNSDWINKEARVKKDTRLTHKSTYLTMPKAWLGRKILSEIEQMKRTKPKQYEHMYLGMVTGTGGEYLDNIEVRHLTKEEIAKFDYTNMGIDWGKHDPNVFVHTYVDTDEMIGYLIGGIYQKDWDRDSDKSKYQQFAEMVVEYVKAHGLFDDTIWYDAQGDAPASILSGKPYNLSLEPAPKQGANGRDAGGKFLQSLKKIIINDDVPEELREELIRFESLPRPGNNGWFDKPGKKDDHGFDAFRYSEWEAIQDGSVYTGTSEEEYD